MAEKEIAIEIKHPELLLLVLFSIFIFVLELQTTFSTPISFGDEAFHTRMAQWIYENTEYPKWIDFEGTKIFRRGFDRPPAFHFLQASFFLPFGFNEAVVKFLTPFIASILIGLAVFIFCSKFFNKKIAFITSVITITVPSFVTYSVLFYVDILSVFYFVMFIFAFILANTHDKRKYWLLSGVFAAMAALTKTTGLVVFPIIALTFLYKIFKKESIKKELKRYLIILLPIALFVGIFTLRSLLFYHISIFPFIHFGQTQNAITFNYNSTYQFQGRVEESGTEAGVLKAGITYFLDFTYGNIWFVFLTFLGGLVILLSKREFIHIVLLFTLISYLALAYYTGLGRAEDTARFMIALVPVVAITASIFLENLYNFIRQYLKQIALLIFVLVVVASYVNFNSKLAVMKSVKEFSPLFFEACNWAKQNLPKDAVILTVWGHRATYNCQRDTVSFDTPDGSDLASGDLNLTISRLKAHGITHIFLQKFSISNNAYMENYNMKFVTMLETNLKYFENIYENGSPLQQCLQQGGCDGNIFYKVNTAV